jgi:translation elongation factor EF-G
VSFCETVTAESDRTCLSKSPNKHNRIFMKAEPMHADLPEAIEKKTVDPKDDMKARAKIMTEVRRYYYYYYSTSMYIYFCSIILIAVHRSMNLMPIWRERSGALDRTARARTSCSMAPRVCNT